MDHSLRIFARFGVSTKPGEDHIDGVPVAFSKRLLTDELRSRWGWDGVMVTDWDIIGRMHRDRRICATLAEGAARALGAGNDLVMTTPTFFRDTLANLAEGKVTREAIESACRRVLRLKFRLGLFEDPRLPDEAKARAHSGTPAHRRLALDAARKALVLLKNRGVLPLVRARTKKLAVIGPNANDWVNTLGDWTLGSGQGHGTRDGYPDGATVTVYEGLRRLLGDDAEVVHAPGCGVGDPLPVTDGGMPRYVADPLGNGLNEPAPEKIARAVRLAASADAVVLVLGDRIAWAGETKSTATLELPGEQQRLFEALLATGTPLIVVLICSKPLAIPFVARHADAILLAHNPGMEGGTAVAEVLFGDVNPTGRLTMSWPHHVGQQPVRYDQAPGAHQAGYPDLPDANFDALFPFGFGLSYTAVRYHGLRMAKSSLAAGDTIEAAVCVANRGNGATDELVQCYLGDVYTSVSWPAKKLKAWQRVSLEPGETKTVRFTLPYEALALCDEEGHWRVEPGDFELMVGSSSRDADLLRARFVVG